MTEDKKRINVITMGCSKNLVDSEVLLTQLEKGNWEVMHDADGANFDAVVINTCGFIHDAKQESIDMILDYAAAKKRGDINRLYVMGCLSERYQKELEAEIPEVDRYFGKFDLKAMAQELKVIYHPEYIYERKITTPSHFAYLKISEGCNRNCGFCAIPMMTGRHKSRSIDDLVKESRYLARNGVKELLIIAQDLSYYGIDLYGKNQLAVLVEAISEVEGIEWIRLHYLYPSRFPYDILPVMRKNPKVCRYLDMPLQHIADPVLKRMLRHVTRRETEELINRVKTEVPGVALRTTMLVGYPGETENDFQELKEFIIQTRFDRLGVFPYSHEEGTYAYSKFSDDVPEVTKNARAEEIMEIQQQISFELNEDKIGLKFQVIVDRKEGENYVGRTRFDSPEVDGEVIFTSEKELTPGQFVKVKITGAGEYDLFGIKTE
jgi:ribosomal protein S12 methylthiotransferase